MFRGPGAIFIAGLIAGGALAAVLMVNKGRELTGRGNALAQNLAEGGADLESYLMSRGTAIGAEMESMAADEVTRVARESADRYMATVYGLTPERILAIGRLGTALGA